MPTSAQAAAVFLVLVLPGYVWTRTENIFKPKHKMVTIEVVASSLARSIIVNAPLLLILGVLWGDKSVDSLNEMSIRRPLYLGSAFAVYAAGALAVGFVAGYVRGLLHERLSFQAHLRRRDLTLQLEATSVWEQVVVDTSFAPPAGPGRHIAVWVVVCFADGSELRGKVESYPQVVENEKPFWFSLTQVEGFRADGTEIQHYSSSDVVMVHSTDVRQILVKYRAEEQVAPHSIVGQWRTVVGGLVGWPWFWLAMVALAVAAWTVLRGLEGG